MADMPFFSGGGDGGGSGGGGTTNYNALSNKPVTNLTGNPIVIANLSTGVYNIEGTWAITTDDAPRETLKDDLFYVSNENGEVKLTWITASKIHNYSVPAGGTSAEIEEDVVPTVGSISQDLVGSF